MSALRLGITLDVPQELVDVLARLAAAIEGNSAVLGHLIEFPRGGGATAQSHAVASDEITPPPSTEPPAVPAPVPPAGGAEPAPPSHVPPCAPADGTGHGPTSRTRRRVAWRSPEREALMRQAWPAGVPNRDLLVQIAALPGETLPDRAHFLADWAYELKLHRPPEFHDAGVIATWTPERDALLIAQRSAGATLEAVVPLLNELPGRVIASVHAVHQRTLRLKKAGLLSAGLPVQHGKRQYTEQGLENLRENARKARAAQTARARGEDPPSFPPLEPVALALPVATRPAIPAGLRTRDGTLSVAAMELRSAPTAVEVDWDTAAAWAERWAPAALEHETEAEKLAAINDARVSKYFLDPWKLIPRRGPAQPMPGAHLEAAA